MNESSETSSTYIQAATIGILAAIVNYFSAGNHGINPEFGSAVLLYFAAILYSRYPHALTVLTFVLISLLFNHGEPTFGMVRVSLFAFFLSLAQGRRYGLSPVITLCALWEITLIAPLLSFGLAISPVSAPLVSTMLLEITSTLLLWFLASSSFVQGMLTTSQLVERHHVVHLVMLPMFAIAGLALYLTASRTGLTPNQLMISYGLIRQPMIYGWVSLCLAGMLVSATVANVILDLIEKYIRAATPVPLANNERPLCSAFSDGQEILEILRHDSEELMVARRVFKEMQAGNNLPLAELSTLWRIQQRGNEILGQIPDGCFALLPGGQIVAASSGLETLLGFGSPIRVGDHVSTLGSSKHPWAVDVRSFISWSVAHYDSLLKRGARESVTQVVGGEYLEVVLKAWRSRGSGPEKSGPAIISLYFRRRQSTRDMQLQFLQPSEFERIGSATAELFQSLEQNLASVHEQLALLTAKFHAAHDASGTPLSSGPSGEELSQMLVELVKVFRHLSSDVDQQGDRILNLRSPIERIDLGKTLEDSTNHLLSLLGSERKIHFAAAAAERSEGENNNRQESPSSVVVELPGSEVFGFLSYFLLFLRHVIPVARDFVLQLDSEVIGSGTASLLTGSVPGRYARITLRHNGQSITSNVLTAQQDPAYVLLPESAGTIGAALYFVTRQAKRLGGFVSVQSSAAKGTDLTIYLPMDFHSVMRPTKRELRRVAASFTDTGDSRANQVLLVAEENTETNQLCDLLENLALSPIIRHPQDLLGELVTPVEFDGRGFGDSMAIPVDDVQSPASSEGARAKLDFSPFALLVFDGSMADFGALALIDELELKNPSVAKMLLLDHEDSERAQALNNWTVVYKPFDNEALSETIQESLKNSNRVQESLTVIEGNDPLDGTGFS
jgi:hypothetical protein